MKGIPEIQDFINDLDSLKKNFNNYLLVTEKLDGCKISLRKIDNKLCLFKKDDRFPISIVDRTFFSLYEKAFEYVNTLNSDLIPNNWNFGFEYFPSNKPANIYYDRIPKNNLVLTHISIKKDNGKTEKIIKDPIILNKWSSILEVENAPIIFNGKLNEKNKKELLNSDFSIEKIFTILSKDKSTLNESLDKKIDSLIFNFIKDGKDDLIFKVSDVFEEETKKETTDTYSIIIIDIIEFIEKNGLFVNNYLEGTKEQRYIELICNIFNNYIKNNSEKYKDLNFDNPEFTKSEEFSLNTKFINNETTLKYLETKKYDSLFQIFLSTFRKKRVKETKIITKYIIDELNQIIERISFIISLEEPSVKTFNDITQFKSLSKMSFKEIEEQIPEPKEIHLQDNHKLGDIIHNIKEIKAINELETKIIKPFTNSKIVLIDEDSLLLNIDDFTFSIPLNFDKNVWNMGVHEEEKEVKEQGKEKVNIFIGRFQPFTLGHVKVAQELFIKNGLATLFVIVKNDDNENSPFTEAILMKMADELKANYNFIKDYKFSENAFIGNVIEKIRPEYEPVLWGCGSDRIKNYTYQINKDNFKIDNNMLEDFNTFEVKRDDEINASSVRQCLSIDDKKGFKALMPTCLYKYYEELKNMTVK